MKGITDVIFRLIKIKLQKYKKEDVLYQGKCKKPLNY